MSEEKLNINMIFGHCEIRSWWEYKYDMTNGSHAIGMGGCKTFDRDGKLVSYVEKPTGCVLRFDEPKKTFWQRIFA